MDFKALGKRIKKARKDKAYTQEKLGEKIGYSGNHISHVENGESNPSVEFIVTLAKELEISLDELFCDSIKSNVKAKEEDAVWEQCTPKEKKFVIEVLYVYRNMQVNMEIGV